MRCEVTARLALFPSLFFLSLSLSYRARVLCACGWELYRRKHYNLGFSFIRKKPKSGKRLFFYMRKKKEFGIVKLRTTTAARARNDTHTHTHTRTESHTYKK